MALNNSYDEQAVIQAIAAALETFYDTLIEKVDTLNIQKVMRRKNPYLYRAKAMKSAAEIVESVLMAFVSSSEETVFGNCFFEPIAVAASGGNKALAEGIDIMIHDKETNVITAIAVKAAPLYLMLTAESVRSRISYKHQSLHNRQKRDMRLILAIAMGKKRSQDEENQEYIKS